METAKERKQKAEAALEKAIGMKPGTVGDFQVGDVKVPVVLGVPRQRKGTYDMWTIWNMKRAAVEALRDRIGTLNEWRVFNAVVASINWESTRAEIQQKQIALEANLDPAHVSRALKKLLSSDHIEVQALKFPLLRRHGPYFAVNPKFVYAGDLNDAERVWNEAAAMEAASAQHPAKPRGRKPKTAPATSIDLSDASAANDSV